MKNLLLLLFVVVPSILLGFHCRNTISGVVKDPKHSENLSYANIYIVELGTGAVADQEGKFSIKDICDGTYTLKISHIGCKPETRKVLVDGDIFLEIELEHNAKILSTISVEGKQQSLGQGIGLEKISDEDLAQNASKGLAEMLTKISGTNVVATGNGIKKPAIHGLTGNRVVILNNGVKHESQQWGREHAPEINISTAQNVEVVKGVNAIKYGSEAISGVVIVDNNKGIAEPGFEVVLDGEYQSNGKGQQHNVKVPFNTGGKLKLKGFAAANYSRQGNYNTPDRIITNSGSTKNGYNFGLSREFGDLELSFYQSVYNAEIGLFSGSHVGNITDLERIFSEGQAASGDTFSYVIANPKQQLYHELTKGELTWKLPKEYRLKLTGSRQYNLRQEFDKHGPKGSNPAFPGSQFEITTHQIASELEKKSGDWIFQAGTQSNIQRNTIEGNYFIPRFRRRQHGVFGLAKWYISNSKNLEFGLRYDYGEMQASRIKNREEPFSAEYSIPGYQVAYNVVYHDIKLALQHGKAWRMPSPNELFADGLHHGASRVEKGDLQLDPEQVFNNTLSLGFYPEKSWSFDVLAYGNYFQNFIYFQPSPDPVLTIRGAFPFFEYQQTPAWHYGLDLNGSWKPMEDIELSLAGSVTRIRQISTGEYLPDMPAETIRFKATKRFRENKYGLRSVSLENRWVNHQNLRPNYPLSSAENRAYFERITSAPSAYNVMSFNLSGGFVINRQARINYFMAVENLLNLKYQDYTDSFRFYAAQPSRNFRIGFSLFFNQNK